MGTVAFMKEILWILAIGIVGSLSANEPTFAENFEGHATWTSSGELVKQAGNTALKLTPRQLYEIDLGTYGKSGVVSVDIYDFGDIPNPEGPRWGLRDSDELVGVSPSLRKGASEKYYYAPRKSPAIRESWFSFDFIGPGGERAMRPVSLESSPGAGDGSGAWVTWRFTIGADGTVSVTGSGPGNFGPAAEIGKVDDLQTLFFYAHPHAPRGLLVDNISFRAN